MREVSLAILDAAENSVSANAKLIKIEVSVFEDGISFSVSDDGVGMSEEELKSATQKGVSFKGSTGLGLALIKEDAESLGGSLKIISNKNCGTEVFADYPSKEAVLGDLGATFVALTDDGFDVVLTVKHCGTLKRYDTRELKSSSCTADLQSLGALRLIREEINQNIRQMEEQTL